MITLLEKVISDCGITTATMDEIVHSQTKYILQEEFDSTPFFYIIIIIIVIIRCDSK